MDPYEVPRLEKDHLLVFIGLLHGLGIDPFNSLPNLSMKILNFLSSILGLPTKFGWGGDRCKVQRGVLITPIDHLKRGKVCGLTLGPIEGKLHMG